jgi:hypothetical protein
MLFSLSPGTGERAGERGNGIKKRRSAAGAPFWRDERRFCLPAIR